MTEARQRRLSNFLIQGVSAPLVLVLLFLVVGPPAPQMTYYVIPIMLVALVAAHVGRRLKPKEVPQAK